MQIIWYGDILTFLGMFLLFIPHMKSHQTSFFVISLFCLTHFFRTKCEKIGIFQVLLVSRSVITRDAYNLGSSTY